MIKKKIFLMLCFLLINITYVVAQELRCNVIIDDKQVQTQERQLIANMKNAIQQFMNTTKWTNDDFRDYERIKCNIFITLRSSSDVSTGKYDATVQIQSLRPIFGTNYESTLLTYFDRNFSFEYAPSQPLIFTENVFSTNLTAMLAYYSYVILALDYDSFALNGGNVFMPRILNILNNAAQANSAGWNNSDTRNRYWLSENLNNPQFAPLREALYLYHSKGIDQLLNSADGARARILEALQKINQVQGIRPNSLAINLFFDSKNEELYQVFSQGDKEMAKKAGQILVQIDPANAAKYRKLLN